MFLVGELGATINANRKPFDRTLDSVFRDGGRMMQRLGSRMTMALTLPLAGAGTMAVKTAADYERLQTSMSVLNGSVEEGARQFERLQEFSARTPFQLQDLAQAQNMLQGFGLTADEAFDSLSMIGDIAAVSGGDIQGIGIAFGQASAEGRLMTRDIRQLINQGVPAIKLLADTMGVAQDEVLDLASEGEISFEILQQAFRDATKEGGMFADGMRKQSETIGGLFSTLKDNASIALGEIGDSLVETFDIKGLIGDLTESIQTGISWFNSLSEETRAMAFKVAGLLGASGPIIAALGTLSLAFSAISAPLAGVVALVGGATTAIVSNWDEIVQYFTQGAGNKMWESIKSAGQSLFDTLKDLFQSIADFITAIWGIFGDDMISETTGLMERVVNAVEVALDGIGLVLDTFTLAFTGDWDTFWTNNEDRVTRFGENLEDYFKQLFTPSNILAAAKRVTFVNIAEAWARQIGEGLANALKGVPDEPMIFRNMEDSAQGFFGRLNGMAERSSGVLKTNVQQMLDDLQQFQQFLSMDFSTEEIVNAVAKPFVKAKRAADEIIQAQHMVMQGFQEMSTSDILADVGNVNLAEKMFPPGSLGFLQQSLQNLSTQLRKATDPEIIARLQEKIGLTQEQIKELTGQSQQSGQALAGFLTTLDSIFQQAVLHGEKLGDILKNVAKQFASKALINGLAMLLSGGSFGIGKLLFGSVGNIVGVNDALVRSNGDIVKFHPDDNLLAMKDFSNLMPSGDVRPMQGQSSSMSGAQMEQAFSRALDRKLQKLGPHQLFGLMQRGSVGY